MIFVKLWNLLLTLTYEGIGGACRQEQQFADPMLKFTMAVGTSPSYECARLVI